MFKYWKINSKSGQSNRLRKRLLPRIEQLESINLLSLYVSAYVNLLDDPPPQSSNDDSLISTTATGVLGHATSVASGMQLDVQTNGGDALNEGADGLASGRWNFQIVGVPQGVSVPLDFLYTTDFTAEVATLPSNASIAIASADYDVYADISEQKATLTNESQNDHIVYQQTTGDQGNSHVLSATFTNSGYLVANIQASSAGVPGTTSIGNASFKLLGVSTSAAIISQYPNAAIQFDDGVTMSPNPFLVSQGQFTFNAEGNDNPKDKLNFSRHISFPDTSKDLTNSKSGVTIGRGYDLGGQSSFSAYADLLAAGVPFTQAQEIANGAGLTGVNARNFVFQNQATIGNITPEQQKILFENTYLIQVQKAKTNYDLYTIGSDGQPLPGKVDWNDLAQPIRDIVVDIVYNGYQGVTTMPAAMTNNYTTFINFLTDNSDFMKTNGSTNRNTLRIQYLINHKP